MKNFNLIIRNILPLGQTRQFAGLATVYIMALLLPGALFAQSPSISYSGPQTYNAGVAITPLSPTSSNVSGFGYTSPVQVGSGFNNVSAMAADASGNIYVVDNFGVEASNGNISNASYVKEISASNGSITSLYSDSFGIQDFAVDPGGNMYLIDHDTQITEIPHGGSASTSFQIGSGFNHPLGVAADGAGNVYVADYMNFAIKRINAGSGAVVTLWTGNAPNSVAVDAAGDVFFTTLSTGDVFEIWAGNSAAMRITGGATKVTTDAGGNIIILTNSSVQFVPAGSTTATTIAGSLGNVTAATVDPSENIWLGALITNDSLGVKKMKPIGGYYVSPQLPLGLSFDNSTGTISGTPLSGSAAKDYTVTAFGSSGKASATVNIKVNSSTDATLSDLELSNGTLNPAFASGTTGYTATVGSSVSSITVTPSSSHNASSITVNGTTVASGAASGDISLQTGLNTITVVVTAQDGTTKMTYNVLVTRLSSNANLSNLTLSSVTLNPSFSAGTFSYTATVANGISSITVAPVTQATVATVTVNGTGVADFTPSDPISLNVGSNTITVVVTAQDGVTKNTYTVTVTRLIPPPAISYSTPQTYQKGTAITTLTPTSSGVAAWGYSSSAVSIGSGNVEPLDVAADAAGNVYIADIAAGHVVKIPVGGGSPVFLGAFSAPLGLAVDAAGNVYVADASSQVIKELPAGSSTPTFIGSGFSAPSAVAVDASGNVYVADSGNGALKEIPAGNGTPVTIKSGFASIQGVAVDASGNLYVADAGTSGNGAVYKIPAGGGSTVSVGSGFSKPSGVVVDAAGNLYVSDISKSVITVIEPNGTQFTVGSGFNSPNGVAIDGPGNVYIADSNNGAVKEVNITGGYFLSKLLPAGLAFDNNTGAISGTPSASSTATNYTATAYNVAGSGTATVNIAVSALPPPVISYSTPQTYNVGTAITPLSPANTAGVVAAFGFNTPTVVTTGVSDPVSMAMDKSGNMYIGAGSGNVWLLPAGSNAATVFASGFGTVWSVKLDASNNVYAADGSHVWVIPAGGGTPVSFGSFVSPVDLAFDAAGNLYVADNSGSHPGVYKIVPGVSGQTRIDNNLPEPGHIAFDSNGNLYIGDQYNLALYEIPAGGTQQQVASGVFTIKSLAAGPSGNVYFSTNSSISCYSPGTGVVTVDPTFANGLMTDASFNLYYSDGGNINKMSPSGGYFASPELPEGLIINSGTGVISGTPVSVSPAADYTIKAFNASGSGSASVNITVNPILPVISYSSPQSYTAGIAIAALSPSSSNVAARGYSDSATSIGSGLIQPLDVAADAAGNVYVADVATNNIVKIPAGNGTPVTLATFSTPFGIAVDATGNVYVAAASAGAILEIPAGGGPVNPIGSGFVAPSAVAVDGSGNVYVADSGNGALKEVPAPTGAGGTPVTIKSGFNNIQGVAVDATGNLYVADAGAGTSGNGAVYKIPAGGGPMISVGTGFSRPSGVAVDAAGNLYISDINKSVITVIEPGGAQFTIGSGFNFSNGITIDGLGNVYIADSGNGKVKEVKITGGYFLSPLLPAGLTFNNSTGIVSGTPAAATGAANYTVTAYNGIASARSAINISVVPVISYNSPVAYATGVAITPLTPSVSGGTVAPAGFSTTATPVSTGLNDVSCLAMGPDGSLYIGEVSGRVSVLAPGSSSATVYATGFANRTGSPIHEGIAADASGNVYFADQASVWKIPAGGGTPVTLGSFKAPCGIALDGAGNIYVADAHGTDGGVFKMMADGTGQTRVSDVLSPTVVAADKNGNLFFDDNFGDFHELPAGGTLKTLVGNVNVTAATTDASGNCYIMSVGTVLYLLPAGGGKIQTGPVLTSAKGLSFDANFNLYIADGVNESSRHVVKTAPTGGYFIRSELPAGLTIDPNTGVISGTPTAASSTTDYTVKAFNAAVSATATVNITVGPAPAISYSTPQTYTRGVAITSLLPSSTGAAVSAPGFNTTMAMVSTGISDATCVTMDKAGNMYIGESSGKVSILAPGATIATVYATGFASVSASTTEGIAVDASGNVYFADGSSLWKIPAGGGTAATLGSFDGVQGVALDAAGNIYVSGYSAGSGIFKMHADGSGQTKISSGSPVGITIDQNGNLFAYDATFEIIDIPAGGVLKGLQALSNPRAITADASGNVYVADGLGSIGIDVFPADGGVRFGIGPNFTVAGTAGLFIDSNYNLYIANGTISKVNPTGGYFISPELPAGLTINSTNGAISGNPTAVSPATNYMVSAFSGSVSATAAVNITVNNPPPVISYATPQTYTPGVAITPLTPSSTGAAVGAFGFNTTATTVNTAVNDAVSLAMDKSGNLYIGEGTGNISVIPAGASTATVFATGFPAAWSIALDASDNVFLADGAHVWKIPAGGGTAVSLGSFHSPVGLAFDAAGNIYVADNSGATGGVFKMNSDGTGQTRIDNNLPQPAYLAFDNNGNLYIGDQTAGALYEIPAGGVQKQVASGLGVIVSVVTDPSGNVYISGRLPNGIYCYSPVSGLTSIDPVRTNGLMTDANFNLYYASGGVHKLSPAGGYFTNPQLPAGLTIDPATGAISGTPTAVSPATDYTVTAFSGSVSGTAPVNIKVASTDATLASLSLSSGTLSPTFSPGGISYAAGVPYSASSITVTATPTDAGATVVTKVNGTTASGAAPLNPGVNTINVKVTAADGVTTKTYTVAVTRVASQNAYLSSISPSVGHLSPAFAQAVTSYTLSVSNATAAMTVTPVSTDPGASIKVNGSVVTSGTQSNPITLAPGAQTTINIAVTAPNGHIITYAITVTRAPDFIATLSNIQVSAGTPKPVFAPAILNYNVRLTNLSTSIAITPTATDPNATITVNGIPAASGTPETINNLVVGNNTVTIVVTAQDGTTTKTYTVTVNRPPSIDCFLASMNPSRQPLSPMFAPATTSYTLEVPNAIATMTLAPVTNEPHATLTINGSPATSGATSTPITLNLGPNTITIVVTAQDGISKKTYTITVTRDAPPVADVANTVYQTVSVDKPTTTPTLADDGIVVHQGISPNGDGQNDFLQIDNIGQYPENKLSIMNRSGQLVYETKGYDNSSKVFDGHSNKNGQMQLPGTYFYQLDYTANGTTKHKTGFLVLKY